ncbi:MAG: 2-oxoglutarate dehydrogenase E1 component [Planctomycetota bacterium]
MPAKPSAVGLSVNGWNGPYLDEMYERFQRDPASVPPDVRGFLQGFELGSSAPIGGNRVSAGAPTRPAGGAAAGDASPFQARVSALIAAYRGLGHTAAKIDPFSRDRERPRALQLDYHKLSEADFDRECDATQIGMSANAKLRDVVENLERTYCGTIGIEIMHVQDRVEREWLLERVERNGGRIQLDRGLRVHVLEQLIQAESFERFLGKRYPGEKRFSLEGGESLIPLLDRVIEEASNLGTDEVVLGMAHRGRLNVLNNILGKTYEQIFTEFEDNWDEDFVDGGGDVKYHRGYSGTRLFGNGKKVHLAMASNPSHLEAVGPVVLGRCRAKQRLRADTANRSKVFPVLVHGDAAVAGQGIVAESLNMSQLDGYAVGGCVRVVVNNQIGFTTLPEDGRSSRYCTDVAKMIESPIFHVNGEDPEAVVVAAQVAVEYRQRFHKDVFIDMYCYRRFGHNEQDEQSFTQPVLAAMIKKKPSVLAVYAERLLAEGVITEKDMSVIHHRLHEALELAQKTAREEPHDPTIEPGSEKWVGFGAAFNFDHVDTHVSREALEEVCNALGSVPDGFNVNRKLKRLLEDRSKLLEDGALCYGDAESLAFGTLLLEGAAVRVSGQDCRRGTFSHRHAVLRDAETGEPYTPLNHIRELGIVGTDEAPGTPGSDGRSRQGRLCIYDSPLSEAAVLGFDYGYSLADPNMLVCWEAQFGDFANGAQTIIDQFVASAETKWQRWSSLVMLLPHGYEGAGPEHSSARLERFLKLCGDDNMQVCYPTTGGQIFHLLRRQLKRTFRKPLVVMTPKSMLRVNTSKMGELMEGSFQEIMDDPAFESGSLDRSSVKRVILCCGKIGHELIGRRDKIGTGDTAVVRLEQVYPFHAELAKEILARYPKKAEIVWCQEEPRNMGAYTFARDRFVDQVGIAAPRYIGRSASSSPAVGSKTIHKVEQKTILDEAVGVLPETDATKSAEPARASA